MLSKVSCTFRSVAVEVDPIMIVPSIPFDDVNESLIKFLVLIMAIESVFDFKTILVAFSWSIRLVFSLF
jgi:hypothetical protein